MRLDKVKSFLLIFLYTIILIIFLDLLAYPIYKFTSFARNEIASKYYYDHSEEAVKLFGYRALPNVSSRVQSIVDDQQVYDVGYDFDKYSRRKLPESTLNEEKYFTLFFGGSNIFGEGLNSNQTLPYFLSKNFENIRAYNYGFRGYGPQQMLSILQNYNLVEQIKQKQGIAIYKYFSFHIGRAIGSMRFIRWSRGVYPYYFLDKNDQLIRKGNFNSDRFFTTKLYQVFGFSNILRLLDVEFPINWFTKDNMKLICAMIMESQVRFNKQFPKSKFITLIGDGTEKRDPIAKDCLEQNDIAYIDLRDTAKNAEVDAMIWPEYGEYHANEAGNKLYAEIISDWIIDNKIIEELNNEN